MKTDPGSQPLVVVTGAAGLIGGALLRELEPEYRLVALDVAEPGPETAGAAAWVSCDLTEDESTHAAFETIRRDHGSEIASVVHLAAYYDFSGKPSTLYRDLTVEGTGRVLRELEGFDCGQIVFSSSLLVMKPADDEGAVLTEASPTQAEWEYPRSKLEAERVLSAERGDVRAVVLRIAGVYDEGCHSIPIAQQIRRIYEKELESHFFPGNRSHGQSFLHLDDATSCFRRAIEARTDLDGEEVFLVGEPHVTSYGELQDRLGELIHGHAWLTLRVPKPVAKAGAWVKEKLEDDEEVFIKPWMVDLADAHYPVSIETIERRLGWKPRHRLDRTLPAMIERLERNPARWYEENGLGVPEEIESGSTRRSARSS